MVPKTNAVPLSGRKKKIERYVERLGEGAFSEVRSARDTSGRRPWEWVCVDLAPDPKKGMRRWLLVRRSTDDPEDLGFYQAYGPGQTTVEEMPEEHGKWEAAYRHHELWVKQGLWKRILRVLGKEDLPGPATKEPN